jgi:hypothetical protein
MLFFALSFLKMIEWKNGLYGHARHLKSFERLAYLISQDEEKEKYGDDVVFIHRALFTGTTLSKEVAITIAKDNCRK